MQFNMSKWERLVVKTCNVPNRKVSNLPDSKSGGHEQSPQSLDNLRFRGTMTENEENKPNKVTDDKRCLYSHRMSWLVYTKMGFRQIYNFERCTQTMHWLYLVK